MASNVLFKHSKDDWKLGEVGGPSLETPSKSPGSKSRRFQNLNLD